VQSYLIFMKRRFCDRCHNEIGKGKNFYKVYLQKHIDRKQVLTCVGDLCMKCVEWTKHD